jgi:hypothetical protein
MAALYGAYEMIRRIRSWLAAALALWAAVVLVAQPAEALTRSQMVVLFGGPPSWVLKGAAYDLNFATGQYYGASLSQLTCSRASAAMAQDTQGNWHTFGPNVPAITNLGLWGWEGRTNLFLNSQAPATQTITVVSGGVYTASLYGTGLLVLSGAATGTVTQGSPVSFVASSTSLVVTTAGVTGAFINAQVELNPSATTAAQGFATSPILTSGSAQARAADVVTMPVSLGASYTMLGFATPMAPAADVNTQAALTISASGSNNNRIGLRRNANTGIPALIGVSSGTVFINTSIGGASGWVQNVPEGIAIAAAPGDQRAAYNGALDTNSYSQAILPIGVNKLNIGSNAAGDVTLNGVVSRATLWKSRLPNAQLQAITQ